MLRTSHPLTRRRLLPEFGAATLLHKIDTARVDAYRERLLVEGQLSRRTIQKILVLLHGILKRAKCKGWIAANPAADAERVSVRRSVEFNVLTPEEVHANRAGRRLGGVLARSSSPPRSPGCAWGSFGRCDGGRTSTSPSAWSTYAAASPEALSARRTPSVPMSDPVAQALDRLSRRGHDTRSDDLVFSLGHNLPFHRDTARKRFYAALGSAGLGRLRAKDDPIVFHDLRHTFGTLAVQAFPLSDVKAMMGHADISTTMIYVHDVPQTDAAARLTALLEPRERPSDRAAAGA
jgi:integrase